MRWRATVGPAAEVACRSEVALCSPQSRRPCSPRSSSDGRGPAATPPRLPSNARRSNARARNWSSRVVSSSHPPRTINGLLHREVLNLIGQQRDARPATQKAELVAGRAPARARSGPRLVTASRRRTPLRPQAQSRSIESRLRRVLSDGSPALPEPQQPRTEGFG